MRMRSWGLEKNDKAYSKINVILNGLMSGKIVYCNHKLQRRIQYTKECMTVADIINKKNSISWSLKSILKLLISNT